MTLILTLPVGMIMILILSALLGMIMILILTLKSTLGASSYLTLRCEQLSYLLVALGESSLRCLMGSLFIGSLRFSDLSKILASPPPGRARQTGGQNLRPSLLPL
jgi:hypothetical protein